jgi:Rieske Fe-S protein
MNAPDPRRRALLGGSARVLALASLPGAWAAAQAAPLRAYPRVALHWDAQTPLRGGDLRLGQTYVFAYPYRLTPCFLLRLGDRVQPPQSLRTAGGEVYPWPGAVGDGLIAYSAICPHRLTYPSPQASFIDYRHRGARFRGADGAPRAQDHVIHCCSDGSVFDAARGGAVVAGPAPEPLAAIELAYEAGQDRLSAVGVRGAAQFQRFFETFGFQLRLAHGEALETPAEPIARVQTLADYSAQVRVCREDRGSDLP